MSVTMRQKPPVRPQLLRDHPKSTVIWNPYGRRSYSRRSRGRCLGGTVCGTIGGEGSDVSVVIGTVDSGTLSKLDGTEDEGDGRSGDWRKGHTVPSIDDHLGLVADACSDGIEVVF